MIIGLLIITYIKRKRKEEVFLKLIKPTLTNIYKKNQSSKLYIYIKIYYKTDIIYEGKIRLNEYNSKIITLS